MIAFAAWAGVEGNKKKACFGDLKFPTKPGENLLFYLYRVSVGDYLPLKGSRPQNITNS
jgi:hypothetical protein